MPAERVEGGFGIYVHWPFCAAKCPYCDFNSHVRGTVDQKRWAEALSREIGHYAARLPGREVSSIFFGGGTPSLMEPSTVAAVMEAVARHWTVAEDLEVTLEANPTSVEAGRFDGYAAAGVNRLSMGVQALNDTDLKALGRLHSVEEALRAFDVARARFSRVSFDLIYARQQQTEEAWAAELRRALDLAVDHLSLYQLTIEPGTAFGARFAAGGLRGLPDEDLAADMYAVTQELCAAAGLPGYEISNHARPGAESRHNLVYWRYGEYVGVGPGAHGRFVEDGRRRATAAISSPEAWISAVQSGGHGRLSEDIIPAQEEAEEYLMMALRLREGADLGRYEAVCGQAVDPGAIGSLEVDGFVRRDGARIAATEAGKPVLNALLRSLLA